MSEHRYTVKRPIAEGNHFKWVDTEIYFSDAQDEWGCLCTFPSSTYGTLDRETVASLALLGAAVALARNDGELDIMLSDDPDYPDEVSLPFAVPDWIKDEIRKYLR